MTETDTSRSELLTELQRVAEQLDRTPSMQDMAKYGAYAPSTYQSRFGSWNAAVTEVGLAPNSRHEPVYTDEELLAEIRTLATDLDRVPTKADMREQGSHSPTTYADRFGSWQDAIIEAGLTPDHRGTKISRKQLLTELENLAASLGRPPTSTEMDEDGAFSSSTYFRRFNSWDAALDAAGLSQTTVPELSDQELLDEISHMADILNRPPTMTEMDEFGAYSASTYRRRFSSWKKALSKAGFDSTEQRQGAPRQISEQKLLEELRTLAAELSRPPTAQDMSKQGSHSPATYLDRFSSWNAALEAAGCEPRRFRKGGISNRELIRALRELASTTDHCPQRQEMEEHGPISGMTYYNRFGSWQKALDEAGFTSTSDGDPAVVQGYCTVCCTRVTVPLSELDSDGQLYCTTSCKDIHENNTIHLEDDILVSKQDKNQLLGRFAALLHNKEIYVPDVLFYLYLSIILNEYGFDSAINGRYQISCCKNTVEVIVKTDSAIFKAEISILEEIADRIAQVAKQTKSLRLLPALRPDRGVSDSHCFHADQ